MKLHSVTFWCELLAMYQNGGRDLLDDAVALFERGEFTFSHTDYTYRVEESAVVATAK